MTICKFLKPPSHERRRPSGVASHVVRGLSILAFTLLTACAGDSNGDTKDTTLVGVLSGLFQASEPRGPLYNALGNPPYTTYLQPTSGATIYDDRAIQINFSESMNPSSLVFGGSMAAEAIASWSHSPYLNGVLVIQASPRWTTGSGRTLSIDANDAEGEPLTTINLTYDIIQDLVAPTLLSVTPTSGSTITETEELRFVFSESLHSNLSYLSLSGTMASQVRYKGLATTNVVNDTVVVRPHAPPTYNLNRWTPGTGQTLQVDVRDPAQNTASANVSYDVEDRPSIFSATPANPSTVRANGTIKVIFSRRMNPASLSLGGSLASGISPVWSSTYYIDDTITLTPTTAWPNGSGQTLIVDCNDTNGVALTTKTLTFAVVGSVLYVSATGSDANAGTETAPKATVQGAINYILSAFAQSESAEIRVAGGTYVGATLLQRQNTALYGGYQPGNWNVRDPATYVSRLEIVTPAQATLTISNGTGGYAPNAATIVDGFTIVASTSTNGLSVVSTSTVRYNKLITLAGSSQALYVGGGSPVIEYNTIGDGSDTYELIRIEAGSSILRYNTILSPTRSSGSATTLRIEPTFSGQQGHTQVLYNTISGGNCPGGWCVALRAVVGTGGVGATTFTIENNTIQAGNGQSSSAVQVLGPGPMTAYVRNNTIKAGSGTTTVGLLLYGNYFSSNALAEGNYVEGGKGTGSAAAIEAYGTLAATIQKNRLYGGDPTGSVTHGATYGVRFVTSNLRVFNNLIATAPATAGALGIHLQRVGSTYTGTALVLNNTIVSPPVTGGVALLADSGISGSRFENNIVYQTNASTVCVAGIVSVSPPLRVRNNNLFGCSPTVAINYSGTCGGTQYCTLAQLNALSSVNFGGNVALNPVFTDADGADNDANTLLDNDYSLNSGTPAGVTGGGRDNSGLFTTDFVGTTRTTPWSIGAYEY